MTVSEIARLFEVQRDVVKSWAIQFPEYLSSGANPGRGIARAFSRDDLRVLAYIHMYLEDEPDYENIKYGLNTNSHFEEPYNSVVAENTPIFQEPSDDLDETWRHGTIIGGIVDSGDTFYLAEAYKDAGDSLVNAALAVDEVYDRICPIMYNYRHATELYLKAVIDSQLNSHDLRKLLEKFTATVVTEFNESPPLWFQNIVTAFADFDPKSTMFRYGDGVVSDEGVDRPPTLEVANETFCCVDGSNPACSARNLSFLISI